MGRPNRLAALSAECPGHQSRRQEQDQMEQQEMQERQLQEQKEQQEPASEQCVAVLTEQNQQDTKEGSNSDQNQKCQDLCKMAAPSKSVPAGVLASLPMNDVVKMLPYSPSSSLPACPAKETRRCAYKETFTLDTPHGTLALVS
ncbi:hypothetical protein CSPX01_11037 [Colletotrichum filicis]|nr:hypothetical protein CSPX01_11037 [Colletotrichum filicis]